MAWLRRNPVGKTAFTAAAIVAEKRITPSAPEDL